MAPPEEISQQIRSIFSLMDGEEEDIGQKKGKKKGKEKIKEKKDITFKNKSDEILFWGCVLVASISSDISEEEVESIQSIIDDEEIDVRCGVAMNPYTSQSTIEKLLNSKDSDLSSSHAPKGSTQIVT